MAERHARVGDGDLRLRRVLGQVGPATDRAFQLQFRLLAGLPVAEQAADLLLERTPFDVAGHRQDAAARLKVAGVVLANALGRQPGQPLRRAAVVQAQGRRVMPAAQFDQHLLPRLVLQALDVLQGQGPHRVQLVGGQVRPAEDVGVDLQGVRQVAPHDFSPVRE